MSEVSVLIADDEPAARRFVRRHLETLAPRVTVLGEVSNSSELVSSLSERAPDILILDVMMPGITGLDALRDAGAAGATTKKMKTIIISAHDRFEFAQKALSLGVSEYLLKPVRPAELLSTVDRCMQSLFEDRAAAKALELARAELRGRGALKDASAGATGDLAVEEAGGTECQRLVGRAMALMRARMAEDITLSEVAKSVFVSPGYLCRLFKAVCGVNLREYLTTIRIERAKELLANSALSCGEVGRSVGYGNPSHFSQAFRRATGQSPSEYREHVNKHTVLCKNWTR